MISVSKTVKKKILNSPDKDKLWSCNDFSNLSRTAVAKALSNLCKAGVIARAEKGLYYVPRTTILGKVPVDDRSVAFTKVAKKAKFYCISGLSGYNMIGLTTQVPRTFTIACDYPLRNAKDVRYILRRKPHSGSEIERIILDAIRDIDKIPDANPPKSIEKIKRIIKLKLGNFTIDDLGKSALFEPPKVKAIVGALGQELGMNKELLSKLHSKINSSTVVYSDANKALKFSNEWKIKPLN